MSLIQQTIDKIQKSLKGRSQKKLFFELISAIQKNDLSNVEKVLNKNPSVAQEFRWGNKEFQDITKGLMQIVIPLVWVFKQSGPFTQTHLEMVKMLLKNGSNPLQRATVSPVMETRVVDELITHVFSDENVATLRSNAALKNACVEMLEWISQQHDLESILHEQPNWAVAKSRHPALSANLIQSVEQKQAYIIKQSILSHLDSPQSQAIRRRKM